MSDKAAVILGHAVVVSATVLALAGCFMAGVPLAAVSVLVVGAIGIVGIRE